MAITTFTGPVKSINGFIGGYASVSSLSTGSTAITKDNITNYAGKTLYYGSTSAATIVLPAINASTPPDSSGPGGDYNSVNNIGSSFIFVLGATVTGDFVVKVANSSDTIFGISNTYSSTTGDVTGFVASGTDDTINLNGTTKGGRAGSIIRCTAVAANKWFVELSVSASGSLATPFSATV
jgi:hypothetical protein